MAWHNSQSSPVILVVEDDDHLRCDAAESLVDSGYKVIEASNAEDALDILQQRRDVHVLFTDVQMPGAFDGIELARQVHERWPHVMLLVTSGGVDVADEDLPDHGVFISKPYRPSDLIETIARVEQKGGALTVRQRDRSQRWDALQPSGWILKDA